jgi:arabinofuranan 3-O-arabinosyltransferase
MTDAIETPSAVSGGDGGCPRLLGIFAVSRLNAYGYTLAIIYGVLLVHCYRAGIWIAESAGAPIYTDFTDTWVAGWQALHGNPGLLYDPSEFMKIQAAIVGPKSFYYPNWPYPPPFFFILAPLAVLPYVYAFLVWDLATLGLCITVVYLIVRRLPAIGLVLAFPYTVWNFLAGQNGFLTGSLLGAALLLLERRPVLAGVFIGCLTYKPQFGILLPLALVAAREWRALGSATAVAILLACASIVAFGIGVWTAFPRGLGVQAGINLFSVTENWGHLQTVYGVLRTVHAGPGLAWLAQGTATLCVAIIVWRVWRSPVRYSLKAATLSSAALIATPYAFAYDLAALAIPVAFLAKDQMRAGLLRGEQTIMIALFSLIVSALAVFRDPPDGVTFGSIPLGPILTITLLGVILRRTLRPKPRPAAFAVSATSGSH